MTAQCAQLIEPWYKRKAELQQCIKTNIEMWRLSEARYLLNGAYDANM